jgi:hypothetical protein
MDGLTSIAGGWDSTPGWFHTIIYSGAGIVVGGAIGLIVCAKTESCKSRFPNLFKKDSENGSANASPKPINTSANSANQSPKPVVTSSTPVNSTPNQKSTTQGGRQTRRARKYRQSTSKKTHRSRK